jgi:hypothetical protein
MNSHLLHLMTKHNLQTECHDVITPASCMGGRRIQSLNLGLDTSCPGRFLDFPLFTIIMCYCHA